VDVVVYDEENKRYTPLLVALCATVLGATIVGGLSYELGRSQPVEQPVDRVAGLSQP